MQALRLEDLRSSLIRQEETIIFALIERAQFRLNHVVYERGAFDLPNFEGSFSDFLLWETEKSHALVRRYTSPDEHPFFDELPPPILPPMDGPQQIRPNAINLNQQVRGVYRDSILPRICREGDCHNYGSSATCDVACLQALSKRIHYGKFVAEAKFQAAPEQYSALIRARDNAGILAELENAAVEARLCRRVEMKGAAYGQDIDADATQANYKIEPAVIADIYQRWIIPLTKEVEVLYLLERLDG